MRPTNRAILATTLAVAALSLGATLAGAGGPGDLREQLTDSGLAAAVIPLSPTHTLVKPRVTWPAGVPRAFYADFFTLCQRLGGGQLEQRAGAKDEHGQLRNAWEPLELTREKGQALFANKTVGNRREPLEPEYLVHYYDQRWSLDLLPEGALNERQRYPALVRVPGAYREIRPVSYFSPSKRHPLSDQFLIEHNRPQPLTGQAPHLQAAIERGIPHSGELRRLVPELDPHFGWNGFTDRLLSTEVAFEYNLLAYAHILADKNRLNLHYEVAVPNLTNPALAPTLTRVPVGTAIAYIAEHHYADPRGQLHRLRPEQTRWRISAAGQTGFTIEGGAAGRPVLLARTGA